jgi:Ca2+-binding RTX toxin-like protein
MAKIGTNGDDFFFGTIFAEAIFGLEGNDLFGGSRGADRLDGGSGDDMVNYVASAAVDVDLERPVQLGGFAEGDMLISIESIGGSFEDDSIRGDGAANVILANGGDDTVEGRGGNDDIFGDAIGDTESEGNDHLDGGSGVDQLFGYGGSDTLIGGPGFDRPDGGQGVDTATYASSIGGVTVNLVDNFGSGGDAAGDQLFSIENVTGSAFQDTLVGSAGANVLNGGGNNDLLAGRGGADTLDGGSGADTATYTASSSGVFVDLGSGTGTGGDAEGDTLISIERVIGSGFTDVLVGNDFANTLDGAGGADFLLGGAGNDIYIVDNAGDAVGELAGNGIDEVRSFVTYTLAEGADIETLRTAIDNSIDDIDLIGNATNNQITGNNGDNQINGGAGVDQLIGRGGNDIYFVDNVSDSIAENAGQGADEVRANVSYVLTAGADVEALRTVDDNGVAAIDLTGNETGNLVRGNNGANVLNGGAGNDELTGLGGQDAFRFDTALDAANNLDVIADFTIGTDTIQLENTIFSVFSAGPLAAERFALGAPQDGNDNLIYHATDGALFFDLDGTGTAAAIQFAQLATGLALTSNDFLVV